MSSNAKVFGWPAALLSGALAALPAASEAQPMYKCLQGNAVTYSNTACEQLGLKSAGVVQDRITTMPLGAPAHAKGPSASGKPQSVADLCGKAGQSAEREARPVAEWKSPGLR